MKRIEDFGLAIAVAGLMLLSAAFVVALEAPGGGSEIATPFVVANR
jgi:hypothetical protein